MTGVRMLLNTSDAIVSDADGRVSGRDLAARHAPGLSSLDAVRLMHRMWRLRVLSFRGSAEDKPWDSDR